MRAEYREEPCKTALNRVTGMSFRWSLNPYMGCVHRCTFCFVRAFEKLADRPSDDRYGTSIRVKTNLAEVLRRELARRSWKRELVVVGTATDPYQPAEGRFRLTRSALVALHEACTPFSIITRGPLIVRDRDVLAAADGAAGAAVTFSIPTLDPAIWRKTEPGTAPPAQRLRAVRALADAGVRADVGMAPILPGLSDDPQGMAAVVRAARDAGATGVWANVLYLKPGTREHFLANLARDWPELLDRYEALYEYGAYVTREVAQPVKQRVAELRARYGLEADRRSSRRDRAPEPASLPTVGREIQAPGQLGLAWPQT
jgi:DNA repair photolyase